MRVVLALAVAGLLASGCTLLTATPPEVEVIGVELHGLGLLEQQLGVTLCVTNPNREELAFQHITVALDAAGAPLAAGASDAAIRLPAQSSTVVPFTVVTTVRNLGQQLLGVVRAGTVDYRLRGTVSLTGTLALTLPFSRSGRLDLLTTGEQLLADATAPSGTRCGAASPYAPSRPM